jgi:tetratricopeptide (TPR) repeat protein
MRTNLIRPLRLLSAHALRLRGGQALAVAALVVSIAATALAQQPVFRGKVVDEKGTPVADAALEFVAQFQSLTRQGKTDNRGEFLIVGLPSGEFQITAKKEGVGEDVIKTRVTQGQNAPVTLTLRPAAPPASSLGVAPAAANSAAAKANQELQALAKLGAAHLAEGRNDEAIAAYSEVVGKAPTCADCYFNLGMGHLNKKQFGEAETAFKKAIELRADHVNAHMQLAAVYNAQKKYDLAAESSAAAAKYSAAAGATGGNADALYNQGVTLFNGGKFADAKTAFEGATKADPKNALAHYQLGMTALNLGDFALAVSSLEQYLVLDPNGPKAAEVKASLPTLKGMVKK